MNIKTILLSIAIALLSSGFCSAMAAAQQSSVFEQPTGPAIERGQQHKSPISQFIDKPFLNAVSSVEKHILRFHEQIAGFKLLPATISKQWAMVAETFSPLLLLTLILMTIGFSITGELAVRRMCFAFHNKLGSISKNDVFSRILHVAVAICLELVYTGIYISISFILFIIFIPHAQAPHTIGANYIIASYYIRLLVFISTVLLSPKRPVLRILPYSDTVSRFLFTWIVILCSLEMVLVRSGIILRKLSGPENTFLALIAVIIVSTSIILIMMILKSRKKVSEALLTPYSSKFPLLPIQASFARVWHVAALLLTLCITFIWEYRVLGGNQVLFGRVILGLLTIPIFGALDIWGGRLLSTLTAKIDLSPPDVSRSQNSNIGRWSFVTYLQYLQIIYRILLLTLMIFLLLGLWDLDIPYGRMFTGSILGMVGIIVLSYMVWQLFTDWVDHKIKAEMPDADEELDEGGKGGSRTGTLLILLRKFVFTILVILAVMFILSAFGLDIGPLIAGAGILGLAISFGAQALVTDIFAGIFFLVDDAFRVGDYINIGTAKGTVDHISLRSVRLRHHLGMVQTIPFGKIDTVTNFSRDYIISKLDLRVKYNTDIELVRKLVKRIYYEIIADEEYGPKLTGKLKSQGIKQMDDSAMIVRVKFTTQPGEQFIMRREIYRRIQEKFAEKNIEFAHRNVTVYMPTEDEINQEKKTAHLGAAAAARLIQEEEELAQEMPQEGDER